MVTVQPGFTYVPGQSAKTARALLNAAAKAGLDPKTAVRTTEGGFVVPDELAPGTSRKKARILPVDPPPEPKKAAAPRRRRKSTTKEGD
jgi:hypothetical protein